MDASLLRARLAPRIVEEDGAIRTRMLEIAAGMADVIAMGRGDPDFHTPAHVTAAAKAAIDADHHHYTGPTGLPALRKAIAANLAAEYGLDYTPGEIVVTAGVQESIMLAMLGLVTPGDEVLITSPRFTTYDTAVRLCGGVPVPVPTHLKDDFASTPRRSRRASRSARALSSWSPGTTPPAPSRPPPPSAPSPRSRSGATSF